MQFVCMKDEYRKDGEKYIWKTKTGSVVLFIEEGACVFEREMI